MKPQKIFEIHGDEWMKGQSLQTSVAVGGMFSSTTNFDPFEISGMMQPSLASVVASDLTITNTPRVITPYQSSGTANLYVHTNDKLYQVLDGSPYTTTDRTAQVTMTTGVRGAIIYKGKYIHAITNQVWANDIPVNSATDVQLYSNASDEVWHPFCVGADGKLYMGDGFEVAKITNVTGTSGNTTGISNESGMYVRHLINDGRYLVVLSDNNGSGIGSGGTTPTVPVAGKFRCQVAFWDMVKGVADQVYEFSDSYITGGAYLDGGIYIFGGDNFYVCNISTPPKAIFSFKSGSSITAKPATPFQIFQGKHSIYWTDQSVNGYVYAYGSLFPGMKKVFYQPYSASYTPSALTFNGTNFYIGTAGTDNFLRVTGTGSTRNTGTVVTAPIILPRPYRFEFIKVVLQQPYTTNDSVTVSMTSQNANEEIYGSTTRTNAQIASKQSLIFDKSVGGTQSSTAEYFEDFQLTVSSTKAVARVEVWATPHPEYSQVL